LTVLRAAVLTALTGVTSITVYDGDVDDQPPADSQGRVYPYVVLWPEIGFIPAEHQPLASASTGLIWDARVTVAAGTPAWLNGAAPLVRATLAGLRPAPGAAPLVEEPTTGADVDRDTAPPRWYAPMLFRTLTP
jgi:hypothetical protein